MIIKYPEALDLHLKNNLLPVYLITGNDPFLLNTCVDTLKKSWHKAHGYEVNPDNAGNAGEQKRIHVSHANDWADLIAEANTYSLFSEQLLINASWDKKTLDAKGKAALKSYAANINSNCMLILQAPLVPIRQWPDFSKHPDIALVTITSPNAGALLRWIEKQLKQDKFTYARNVPNLIQEYTQGNMRAAAQTIERLTLIHEPGTHLELDDVREQLLDERDYKLYELSGACLEGNINKALDLARRAKQDQTEPTLILWFITQELRLLEQIASGVSHQALNIRSFRTRQYQQASKRLSRADIHQLLRQSQALDVHIKSSPNTQVWRLVEQLIMAMSIGVL
ncbi:MAG: DNA polymerase III subunit delta [Legionellaceae bacterium]|nr:DNA polymerase III subunit delta [Legionellaceae bacterium]